MGSNFNKEIEVTKLSIVADEWRSRRSDAYALIFAALAAIYGGITGLSSQIVSNQITTSPFTIIYLAILILGIIALAVEFLMVNAKREKRLCQLNSLVQKVEKGDSIGDIYEVLTK